MAIYPANRSPTEPALIMIKQQSVQVASEVVQYLDSGGEDPPVVFLHPGSGSSAVWEQQVPVFTAAGFRFIAIDYISPTVGYGGSSLRIAAVVGHLNLAHFHLVGVAAGGGASFEYALAFGDRLLSLTVANSIGNVRDSDYVSLSKRLRPATWAQLPVEFQELGPSYRAANPEGVTRWKELSHALHAALNQPVDDGQLPTMASNVAVTWKKLANLAVPTLLITGDADLYTPPSVLRLFAAHIPGSEMQVIAESGHASYWECPETFNRVVLDFLGRHSTVPEAL